MRRFLLSLLILPLAYAQNPVQFAPYQVIDTRTGQGIPCVGCSIYTYLAGTTTPVSTYTDTTLGTPNTNPVLTNAAGYAVNGSTITGIWLSNSVCYKFILKDASNVTIWTQDNLCGTALGVPGGSCQVGFQQTGGITTTVCAALKEHPFSDQYASMQSALNDIPANGYLTVSGTNTINSGLTLTASNVTIRCDPGAKIIAGSGWSGSAMLLISGSNVTIGSDCLLDGDHKATTTGIGFTGSPVNATVKYTTFQNMASGCVSIPGNTLTGFYRGDHNRCIHIGTGAAAADGVGFSISNASTSNPSISLLQDSYGIYDDFTSNDAIHIFQGNMAEKTEIVFDHLNCTRMFQACAEGDTGGAQSVKFIAPFCGPTTNNTGSTFYACISWAMADALYPSGDLDGDLAVVGGTVADPLTGAFFPGHGYGIELFGHNLSITGTTFTGLWGSAIAVDGSIIVNGVNCSGADSCFGLNTSDFAEGTVKVVNSNFSEIVDLPVQVYAADCNVSGNSFTRTPGLYSGDNGRTYYSMDVGGGGLTHTGGCIANDNTFIVNSGTTTGFTLASIHHNVSSGDTSTFLGNHMTSYTGSPYGIMYASAAQFNGATIGNSVVKNIADFGTLGQSGGALVRAFNNIDLSGNLAGNWAISNSKVGVAVLPNCGAFARGVSAWVYNSNTQTFGVAVAAGGTYAVQAACNPDQPVASGTYTSGITATGGMGDTCALAISGPQGAATATVALTGMNTIAGGTALVITAGGGFTTAPSAAVASNGSATCTGSSVVIATVLGSQVGWTVTGK